MNTGSVIVAVKKKRAGFRRRDRRASAHLVVLRRVSGDSDGHKGEQDNLRENTTRNEFTR